MTKLRTIRRRRYYPDMSGVKAFEYKGGKIREVTDRQPEYGMFCADCPPYRAHYNRRTFLVILACLAIIFAGITLWSAYVQ